MDSDVAIDSTAVDNLGAMVTDLSPEKFEEVDAADLERNLEAIKTDMASASVKENSQRYAVIQKLGTKVRILLLFFTFLFFFFFFPFCSAFPKRQILDSSKLKEFADDNFKFDENGRKLSKQIENSVVKGEIAHDEQFLLFPHCF